MPNWCRNTLIITKGEPKPVFDAVRTESSLFDFNSLIPLPREIADAPVHPSMVVPEWYRWSCQNWGTKWNSAYAQYSSASPRNTIHFDTAWGPPVPVFEALAKRFPEHEIAVYSDEDMNHLHATFALKEGGVVWTRQQCSCIACDDAGDRQITREAAAEPRALFGAEEAK
jgi:hypothetical protein